MGAGPPREQESGGRPRPALQAWPKSHRDPAARLPPRLPPPGRSARPPHASATSPVSGAGVPRCSRRDPGGCGPAWPAPCLLRASGWDFAHTISLPAWGRWHVRAHVTAGGQPGGFPDSQMAAPLWPPRPCRDPPLTPRTAPFSCLILTALPAADRRAASGDRARGLQGRWRLGPELVRGTNCSPCAPQQTDRRGRATAPSLGPSASSPSTSSPSPLPRPCPGALRSRRRQVSTPGLAVSPACPWAAPAPPPEHPAPQALRPHTGPSPKEPSCAAAALAEVKVTDGDRGPERPLKCHPR